MASASTDSGAWRPDSAFNARPGLRVTLARERGVTPAGLLTVPFRFQSPPIDRWGREWNFDYDTYQTISAGERAREQGEQLQRPSLSTMIVDQPERWLVWDGTFDVQRLVKELRLLLQHPAPFRLTIGQPELWGPTPLLNIVAVFTSLKFEERGGEIGTEYADAEWLEWPRERLSTKARRPSQSENEQRYTVKPDDTLYRISRAAYHRANLWHTIAKENGITKVSPDSVAELHTWLKQHSRKTLKIPPYTTGVTTP